MGDESLSPKALATTLLRDAVRLRRGENLLIETWNHCLPYATACVTEARTIGARPLLFLEDEASYWTSVEGAQPVGRWTRPGSHEWAALAKTDAFVFFPGPADRPKFRTLPAKLRGELLDYNSDWYRRARVARIRGVRSVLGYASDAQAARWGVPADEWRRDLLRGSLEVDPPSIVRAGARIARRLRKGKSLHVTAPNGTDFTLKLRARAPVIDDGLVTPEDVAAGLNMTVAPPGTVIVAVDEKSSSGTAIANRPSYLPYGRLDGGEWEFDRGRLTQARYTEGQGAFDEAFGAAPKGKEIVSIFSVGLNPALRPGVPQVEDQEAGAVCLGIGGNDGYGGTVKCPFVSWIVIGEATVAVDGQPLCDRGELL